MVRRAGLSVSAIKVSELTYTRRIDAECYQPLYLENIEFLKKKSKYPVVDLSELLTSITGGATPLGADYPEDGIPFLRVQNIMQGYLDLSDVVYISPEVHQGELKRSQLHSGDVLLTITGMSYGKAAYVPLNFGEANINQHSVRMALKSDVLPEYVAMLLNSRYGKLQSDRKVTGDTRPALDYEEVRTIIIPVPPLAKQEVVRQKLRQAEKQRLLSGKLYADAESLLASELGLDKLDLSEILFSVRNLSDAQNSKRIDAEYFQPKYERTLKLMRKSGETLNTIADLSKTRFEPEAGKAFNYIEISDLTSDGLAESQIVQGEDAPSRAQWIVRRGNVITSTVRPIRRLSAMIESEQEGFACSSGFVVLQPKSIPPELLLTYLRIPVVCEILNLYTTASMYPAISTVDLLNIPVTLPTDKKIVNEIVSKIQQSRQARHEAKRLLAEAKSEVERLIAND